VQPHDEQIVTLQREIVRGDARRKFTKGRRSNGPRKMSILGARGTCDVGPGGQGRTPTFWERESPYWSRNKSRLPEDL